MKDGKAEDATRQPEQIRRSATPGSSASTRTSPTCATAWSSPASCSPRPAASSSRSATRTCTSCGACWTRCLGARTSCAQIAFAKTTAAARRRTVLAASTTTFSGTRKDTSALKYRQLYQPTRPAERRCASSTRWVELPDGTRRPMTAEERRIAACCRRARASSDSTTSRRRRRPTRPDDRSSSSGRTLRPGSGSTGRRTQTGMTRLACGRTAACRRATRSAYVRFLDDFPAFPLTNVWDDTRSAASTDDKIYVVQTQHEGHRALPPHDHRPWRPRPRPDLRLAARRRTSPSSGAGAGSPSTRAASRSPSPARA